LPAFQYIQALLYFLGAVASKELVLRWWYEVPIALAIAGRSFKGKKKNWVFACFGASAPGS
jgi:hypothetical protein